MKFRGAQKMFLCIFECTSLKMQWLSRSPQSWLYSKTSYDFSFAILLWYVRHHRLPTTTKSNLACPKKISLCQGKGCISLPPPKCRPRTMCPLLLFCFIFSSIWWVWLWLLRTRSESDFYRQVKAVHAGTRTLFFFNSPKLLFLN